MSRRAGLPGKIGLVLLLAVAALLATLAIPIQSWRTGRQPMPPLAFEPTPQPPRRVWIDTDAACGHGRRTDPDDCFAILALARRAEVEIVGISTVFGNESLAVTDRTARELVAVLRAGGADMPEVHRGSSRAMPRDARPPTAPAHLGIQRALEQGPLTVLALGPLTNLAAALENRPELRANVACLVSVMGRRLGHLFHPAEAGGGGMLFGHGPVFRDLNFQLDRVAVERVLASAVSLTLVPYDAARATQITEGDLDRQAALGGGPAWVARRAREWLDYWREDIGTHGFYPFDLLAAAHVVDADLFDCARVHAWIGRDETLFIPLWKPMALLITQDRTLVPEQAPAGRAWYCPQVDAGMDSRLQGWLGGEE